MYLNFAYNICHMSIEYERPREIDIFIGIDRQIYIEIEKVRQIYVEIERERQRLRERQRERQRQRETEREGVRERDRDKDRDRERDSIQKDNSMVTIDRIVIVISHRNMMIYNITFEICF